MQFQATAAIILSCLALSATALPKPKVLFLDELTIDVDGEQVVVVPGTDLFAKS